MAGLSWLQDFLSELQRKHHEMVIFSGSACSTPMCQIRRMIPAYLFLLPLFLQVFLMNPCYEKSKTAKLLRAALMPVIIYLALARVGDRLFWPVDAFFHLNFPVVSFATFHSVCLAIQFGLFNEGSVLAPQLPPNPTGLETETQSHSSSGCKSIGHGGKGEEKGLLSMTSFPSLGERIKFAVWLIFSPRGIGTSWAPPQNVCPPAPRLSIREFVYRTFLKATVTHIMTLACWAIGVKFVQHPNGPVGVIGEYVPQLRVFQGYSDYLIAVPFAGAAWFAIDLLGCLFNLAECLFYQVGPLLLPRALSPGDFDTTLYPPLFNKLWEQDSQIGFWSKGWHSIFRRHIVFCGWIPMAYLFSPLGKDVSKVAGMIGAMVFSGIFHEYVLVASSTIDPSFPTLQMFAVSGVAMVCEVYFKRLTGRRVGGILGRIWVNAMFIFVGRKTILSWVERGLGRAEVPLPELWTWPRFFVPFGALLPERWVALIAS